MHRALSEAHGRHGWGDVRELRAVASQPRRYRMRGGGDHAGGSVATPEPFAGVRLTSEGPALVGAVAVPVLVWDQEVAVPGRPPPGRAPQPGSVSDGGR